MKWGLRAVTSRSTGGRRWGPGVPRRFLGAAALALAVTFAGGAKADVIPGHYIVVLKDWVDGAAVAAEHARSLGALVSHRYQYALNGYAARLSPAGLAAIQGDDRVN